MEYLGVIAAVGVIVAVLAVSATALAGGFSTAACRTIGALQPGEQACTETRANPSAAAPPARVEPNRAAPRWRVEPHAAGGDASATIRAEPVVPAGPPEATVDVLAGEAQAGEAATTGVDLSQADGEFYEDWVSAESPDAPSTDFTASAADCLPGSLCLYDQKGWRGNLTQLECDTDTNSLPDLDLVRAGMDEIDPDTSDGLAAAGSIRSVINRCPATTRLKGATGQRTVYAGQWQWDLGKRGFDNRTTKVEIAPPPTDPSGLTAKPKLSAGFAGWLTTGALIAAAGARALAPAVQAALVKNAARNLIGSVRARCTRSHSQCVEAVKSACLKTEKTTCNRTRDLACSQAGYFCKKGQPGKPPCAIPKLRASITVETLAAKDCSDSKRDLAPGRKQHQKETIKPGEQGRPDQGSSTFYKYKRENGVAKPGYDLHHIVGQLPRNVQKFTAEIIHNRKNIVELPRDVHNCVTGNANSKRSSVFELLGFAADQVEGLLVRDALAGLDYDEQHKRGAKLIEFCGGSL